MRTVLNSVHSAAGAQFCAYHGWEIPEKFGSVETEYQALRRAAGIVDLSFRGKLVATGEDRARFLQGMVSNEVEQLQSGQGNYCFLLNAQGHILADLNVLAQPERLLLDCAPLVTEKLRTTLERYIIMDEVELEDRSAHLGTLAVEGPAAPQVVSAALGVDELPTEPLAHLSPDGNPRLPAGLDGSDRGRVLDCGSGRAPPGSVAGAGGGGPAAGRADGGICGIGSGSH